MHFLVMELADAIRSFSENQMIAKSENWIQLSNLKSGHIKYQLTSK